MTTENYLRDNDASVQHLRSIPALESFTEKDLSELLTVSRIETYIDGEQIIEEKNTSDSRVYYLISGKAKVMKGGKELIVLRRTGDVFGEIGVITGITRSASVFAVGRTMCLAVDLAHIDHLPETSRLMFKYLIFRSFAEILANRLQTTTEELVKTKDQLEKIEKES